jgi:hypothetical protein
MNRCEEHEEAQQQANIQHAQPPNSSITTIVHLSFSPRATTRKTQITCDNISIQNAVTCSHTQYYHIFSQRYQHNANSVYSYSQSRDFSQER